MSGCARFVTVGYDFTAEGTGRGLPGMPGGSGASFCSRWMSSRRFCAGGDRGFQPHPVSGARTGAEAEELLCRPYAVSGRVIPGAARGRKASGFRRANVEFVQEPSRRLKVYVIDAAVGGVVRRGVANGRVQPHLRENPGVGGAHPRLHGRSLRAGDDGVLFPDRTRDERKFK